MNNEVTIDCLICEEPKHETCSRCGYCVTCGDCDRFGCGLPDRFQKIKREAER